MCKVISWKRGWKKFRILDTNWEILGSWEIFGGKKGKRSRKERKKEKKGEKRGFLQFPHKFPNAKNFPRKAKNFPTNFPMLKISHAKLKISPLISQC